MIIQHKYNVKISPDLFKEVYIDDGSGKIIRYYYPAHIADEDIFNEIERMYQEVADAALKDILNRFKEIMGL